MEKYGEKSETATAFTAEAQRKAEKNLSSCVPGSMNPNRPLQIQRQRQRKSQIQNQATACPVR
jgi:hypothetical protein